MMSNNILIASALSIVLFIGGFLTAKHWYSANTVKQEDVTVNHTVTKIVKVTEPNGEVQETTTIDSATKKDDTATIPPVLRTNISFVLSNDISQPLIKPAYGLSVTHQVLGPFTVGFFGLTNKTIGLSVGINF